MFFKNVRLEVELVADDESHSHQPVFHSCQFMSEVGEQKQRVNVKHDANEMRKSSVSELKKHPAAMTVQTGLRGDQMMCHESGTR